MLSSVLPTLVLLAADPVTYLGRQVTVVDPGTDDPDGFFPKGQAKVCVKGQQEKDCYKAPKGFGRTPDLSVVELRKGESALFFETASGGVSGFSIHFALLKFCDRDRFPWCRVDEFKNLLPYELAVSNQSQHAFWDLSEISDSSVFLTADYMWGPREAHSSDHRYIVSVYVRRPDDFDELNFFLVDQFMTVRSYSERDDVLGAEEQEILARLKKVKASWWPQNKAVEPKH